METALFDRVQKKFPLFDFESSLLKGALVNELYATNVYALETVAEHISNVLNAHPRPTGVDLVCKVANVSKIGKHYTSFSSKFCHLYIDKTLPIYDSIARDGVRTLLKIQPSRALTSYPDFVAAVEIIRSHTNIRASTRQFDHFLWIAGAYVRWQNGKTINSELRQIFENPNRELRAQLKKIVNS